MVWAKCTPRPGLPPFVARFAPFWVVSGHVGNPSMQLASGPQKWVQNRSKIISSKTDSGPTAMLEHVIEACFCGCFWGHSDAPYSPNSLRTGLLWYPKSSSKVGQAGVFPAMRLGILKHVVLARFEASLGCFCTLHIPRTPTVAESRFGTKKCYTWAKIACSQHCPWVPWTFKHVFVALACGHSGLFRHPVRSKKTLATSQN